MSTPIAPRTSNVASLIQRFQQQQDDSQVSPIRSPPRDLAGSRQPIVARANEAADKLAASLPRQQQNLEDKGLLVQSSLPNLTSLRSASHQLSDESKAERQKILEAKAKVDEARLALENKRLEEMELQEEIRRESSDEDDAAHEREQKGKSRQVEEPAAMMEDEAHTHASSSRPSSRNSGEAGAGVVKIHGGDGSGPSGAQEADAEASGAQERGSKASGAQEPGAQVFPSAKPPGPETAQKASETPKRRTAATSRVAAGPARGKPSSSSAANGVATRNRTASTPAKPALGQAPSTRSTRAGTTSGSKASTDASKASADTSKASADASKASTDRLMASTVASRARAAATAASADKTTTTTTTTRSRTVSSSLPRKAATASPAKPSGSTLNPAVVSPQRARQREQAASSSRLGTAQKVSTPSTPSTRSTRSTAETGPAQMGETSALSGDGDAKVD